MKLGSRTTARSERRKGRTEAAKPDFLDKRDWRMKKREKAKTM